MNDNRVLKKWATRAVSICGVLLFPLCAVNPGMAASSWPSWLKPTRLDLNSGYAYQYTNNSRPNNFEYIPILPSAVIPISRSMGPSWLRGHFEWNPEIFYATFIHPYCRPLFGITPLQFRYALETKSRWKPYGFLGAGVLYANIDRRETDSHINFNPQGGIGAYYDLNEKTSLILEYRHTHISSAGIRDNNAGLNTHTFLVGVSVKE